AYVVGHNIGVGGALFLDLNTDPYNPIVIGSYDTRYIHDVFVRGDTMWSAEINDGIFSVVDVSNKANPIVMATQSTPSFQTHNLWLSDNGNYLYTTDEISDAFIAAYDVSNLNNITEVDRYQSSPGQNVIPHNSFVKGDFLITSYYRDGVVINDISRGDIIIEVGNYDTSPFSGDGFNGCWGVYPYLSSGLILATDIEEGLFILNPTYQQGCFLEGTVTDSSSGAGIAVATVEILNTTITKQVKIDGSYVTGLGNSGLYDIKVSSFGYKSKTIKNISLSNGATTVLDVALAPAQMVNFNIEVLDADAFTPISTAKAVIQNSNFATPEYSSNSMGNVSISVFEGEYSVIVGKWGYISEELKNFKIKPNTNTVTVTLEKGYYDDFALDFGWTESGSASSGNWVRGVPVATTIAGFAVNPGSDISEDISNQCYVTGNGGGGAGTDDIDDGFTILTSPTFDLSNYLDPYIEFSRWFFNGGGFGGPVNDSLQITISNGITSVVIDQVIAGVANVWTHQNIKVSDWIQPSAQMQISLFANDSDPGHIVEAAFDGFKVVDSSTVAIEFIAGQSGVTIYPQPATNAIHVDSDENINSYVVYDLNGKAVIESESQKSMIETTIDLSGLSNGLYILQMELHSRIVNQKIIISR
ncbi:MAG: choice-of-anchor B family protein, partial [Chitinophagales bacterium]|nr:choice-of-anchor B family protein [Chitinophagales bacterium]